MELREIEELRARLMDFAKNIVYANIGPGYRLFPQCIQIIYEHKWIPSTYQHDIGAVLELYKALFHTETIPFIAYDTKFDTAKNIFFNRLRKDLHGNAYISLYDGHTTSDNEKYFDFIFMELAEKSNVKLPPHLSVGIAVACELRMRLPKQISNGKIIAITTEIMNRVPDKILWTQRQQSYDQIVREVKEAVTKYNV